MKAPNTPQWITREFPFLDISEGRPFSLHTPKEAESSADSSISSYICSAPLCTQACAGLWAPGPWAPNPRLPLLSSPDEGTICKRLLRGTKKARFMQSWGGRRPAAFWEARGREPRVAGPRLGRTAGEALNSQPRRAPGRSSSQRGRAAGLGTSP